MDDYQFNKEIYRARLTKIKLPKDLLNKYESSNLTQDERVELFDKAHTGLDQAYREMLRQLDEFMINYSRVVTAATGQVELPPVKKSSKSLICSCCICKQEICQLIPEKIDLPLTAVMFCILNQRNDLPGPFPPGSIVDHDSICPVCGNRNFWFVRDRVLTNAGFRMVEKKADLEVEETIDQDVETA